MANNKILHTYTHVYIHQGFGWEEGCSFQGYGCKAE